MVFLVAWQLARRRLSADSNLVAYQTSLTAPKQLLFYDQAPASYEIAADPQRLEKLGFDGAIMGTIFEPNDPTADCSAHPYLTIGTDAPSPCRPKLFLSESVMTKKLKSTTSRFQRDIDNLQTMSSQYAFWANSFTLVKLNSSSEAIDFYDDDAWNNYILPNAQTAAAITKKAGLKGIFIDVENYGQLPALFSSTIQKSLSPANASRTLAEYQAKVKERGQQFIAALNKEYPDITVIFTITLVPKDPLKKYDLLPEFIDGVIENANPLTRLHDGFLESYYAKINRTVNNNYPDLAQARSWLTVKRPQLSHNPSLYASRMHPGLAMQLTYLCKNALNTEEGCYYNSRNPTGSHNTTTEIAIRARLRYTEGYVWIYAKGVKAWYNIGISDKYKSEILKSRGDTYSNQPPKFPATIATLPDATEGSKWEYSLPVATDSSPTIVAAKSYYWVATPVTIHDGLIYGAKNLPTGAVFNGDYKKITWTPAVGTAGTYSLIITVNDGFKETERTVVLKVKSAP